MGISTKTRKILWGKSGNACAICRLPLIKLGENKKINITIGEECHIVSSQTNGPRFEKDYSGDLDDYENLLLLCRNHHVEIDTDLVTYPKERLKQIKSNHEIWVSTTLNAGNSKKKTIIHELKRMKSGKDLVDIIKSAHGSITDYSTPVSKAESDLIGLNLEYIVDYIDLFGMNSISKSDELNLNVEFRNRIDDLEQNGFYIFAKLVEISVKYKKDNTVETWNVPVVFIKRKEVDMISTEYMPIILGDIKLF